MDGKRACSPWLGWFFAGYIVIRFIHNKFVFFKIIMNKSILFLTCFYDNFIVKLP